MLLIFVFVIITSTAESSPFPKVIWTFIKNSNTLKVTQLCLDNIRIHAQMNNYEIKIITDENYTDYFQNETISTLIFQKQRAIPPTITSLQKQTIIKLNILETHGGIWIDFHVFMTQSLSWLDNISSLRHSNNKISDPKIIMFYQQSFLDETRIRNQQQVIVYPKYQGYFIAAAHNSQFVKQSRKLYQQFALQKSYEQIMEQLNFRDIDISLFQTAIKGNSKYYEQWVYSIILQQAQMQLDKVSKGKSTNLAVEQYRIIGINAWETSQFVWNSANGFEHLSVTYLTERKVQTFEHKFRFIVKLKDLYIQQINALMDFQAPPYNEHFHTSIQLRCTPPNQINKVKIPYKHIIKDSIIENYLIRSSQKAKNIATFELQFINHQCQRNYYVVYQQFFERFVIPPCLFVLFIYIVRKALLILKPEWGVSRRKMGMKQLYGR